MTNQEEDLHTFQSIAQCDEESAIRWLRQCSYDLDLALRMYFESTGQEALAHPYEMLEPPILRGASSQAPRVGRRYPSVYDRTEEEDDDEEEEDDEFGGDIAADFGIVPHSSPSRSQARRSHAPESLARGDGHLSRLLQPDESYMVTDLTLRKTLELASSSGSRGILAVLVCADAFESSMLNRDIFHTESVKDVLANIFTVWYLAFDRKDLERERDSEALHFFRNYRISPDQDIHLLVLHSETGELLHTFRCNRWKRAVEIGFDPTAFLDDVMTYIEEMHRHEQPSTVHPKVSGPSESTEIAKRCREDTFFDVDAEPSLEEKLLNTAIENSLSDCGQYQWKPTFPPDKYVTEDLERGKKLSTNPIQCKIRFPRGNQVLIACNGDAPCLTIYEYVYKILIQSEELRSSQTHCVQLKLGGFPPRILSNSPEQSLIESGLTVNSLLTVIIRDNDSKEM